MRVVEVWLAGGPADGRLLTVEAASNGGFPDVLVLDQAGLFVGIDDQPAGTVLHRYRRDGDVDGTPVYQYLTPAR